jgi:hypothetical protein
MLVAISIIVVLAGLLIMFLPSITANTSESQGAVNLQGWLNIARQKAIRNQSPYGVRFWLKDPTLSPPAPAGQRCYWVTDLSYIEQPDDLVGPPMVISTISSPIPTTLPTATITLTSTVGFPQATGANPQTISIAVGSGNEAFTQVTYSGISGNQLTGCSGGSGVLISGQTVWWASQLSAISSLGSASTGAPTQTPPIWQPQLVKIVGVDLTGGYGTQGITPANWTSFAPLLPVQPGDLLEVGGGGLLHAIAQPQTSAIFPFLGTPVNCTYDANNNPTSTIVVNTPFQNSIPGTANFRIIRAPRVVNAEPLALPSGVVVDMNTNINLDPFNLDALNNPIPYWQPQFTNALPFVAAGTGFYVDVLFGPSGGLLNTATQGTMNFWVRLPDPNNPNNVGNIYQGSPTIIAVFQGTGLVGAYPVITGIYPPGSPSPNPNPYGDIH